MAGRELTPSPLAPREGSKPEGPRRRRRLGRAAAFGRVIEPDPTEGRGTPICFFSNELRGMNILWSPLRSRQGAFILPYYIVRTVCTIPIKDRFGSNLGVAGMAAG
jgi:hypothetical protein